MIEVEVGIGIETERERERYERSVFVSTEREALSICNFIMCCSLLWIPAGRLRKKEMMASPLKLKHGVC